MKKVKKKVGENERKNRVWLTLTHTHKLNDSYSFYYCIFIVSNKIIIL